MIVVRMLMEQEIVAHVLMEQEIVARVLMEQEIVARVLMEQEIVVRVLMEKKIAACMKNHASEFLAKNCACIYMYIHESRELGKAVYPQQTVLKTLELHVHVHVTDLDTCFHCM